MTTRAFDGTNPTGELMTSGLPLIRSQSVASANGASKFHIPDL
jgi:hypothetical protein